MFLCSQLLLIVLTGVLINQQLLQSKEQNFLAVENSDINMLQQKQTVRPLMLVV